MRREFGLVLLLGAAGAALVVFAVRQTWAQAVFTPPRPLPAQEISVTGQQLVPLASALALAALACLAAVIATRSAARRVAGALLAVLGAGAAAAAGAGVRASGVLATAQADAAAGALGGSTTGGTSPGRRVARHRHRGLPGTGPHDRRALARGRDRRRRRDRPRGPGHRVARPALAGHVGPVRPSGPAARRPRAADSATMWESLSRDLDPTVDDQQWKTRSVAGHPP